MYSGWVALLAITVGAAVFNIFLAAFGLDRGNGSWWGETESLGGAVALRTQTPKIQIPFTHPLQLLIVGSGTNDHLIRRLMRSRPVSLVALRSRFDRVIRAEVNL